MSTDYFVENTFSNTVSNTVSNTTSASIATTRKFGGLFQKHKAILSNILQKQFRKKKLDPPENINHLRVIDVYIEKQVDLTLETYLPKIEADLKKLLHEEARAFVCECKDI